MTSDRVTCTSESVAVDEIQRSTLPVPAIVVVCVNGFDVYVSDAPATGGRQS